MGVRATSIGSDAQARAAPVAFFVALGHGVVGAGEAGCVAVAAVGGRLM